MPHPTTLWRVAALLVLCGVGPAPTPAQLNWGPLLDRDPDPGLPGASVERSEATTGERGILARGPAILGFAVGARQVAPPRVPVEWRVGLAPALLYRGEEFTPPPKQTGPFDLVALTGFRLPISSRLELQVDAEQHIDGSRLRQEGEGWSELVVSTRVGLRLGRI